MKPSEMTNADPHHAHEIQKVTATGVRFEDRMIYIEAGPGEFRDSDIAEKLSGLLRTIATEGRNIR